jgi:hypothetical protein
MKEDDPSKAQEDIIVDGKNTLAFEARNELSTPDHYEITIQLIY